MGMERYSINNRWPGILQKLLGDDYEIIEEGLGWRTTIFDDPRPEFPERNGAKTLPIILETHLPLDLVIIMLGTTDTKEMMHLSSEETTEGMQKLIETIKNYKVLKWTNTPKILVIVPPIVNEQWAIASQLFTGGSQKWQELIQSYKKLAERENILYLDPTTEVKVNEEEGIHIDNENHMKLAKMIYEIISDI